MIEINTLAGLLSALIAAIVGIVSYFTGHDKGFKNGADVGYNDGLARGHAEGYSHGRVDTIRAQMKAAANLAQQNKVRKNTSVAKKAKKKSR